MPFMRPYRPSVRKLLAPLLRVLAMFACVGQMALVIAPVADAQNAQSAALHIEGDGPALHHAHNPDLCPACAALDLVGTPGTARPALAECHAASTPSPDFTAARPHVTRTSASRPRAPPVRLSESLSHSWIHSDTRTLDTDAFRSLAVRAHAERSSRCIRAATRLVA
jgi:hypothetical protein